jgi:hypothetical protein
MGSASAISRSIAVSSAVCSIILACTHAFAPPVISYHHRRHHRPTKEVTFIPPLQLAKKQPRSSDPSITVVMEDEETPAGIGGAEFFGGASLKKELFDPVAEAQASLESQIASTYNRFQDLAAFSDPLVAAVAASLQSQINHVLYDGAPPPSQDYTYSSTMQWITPATKVSKTPLEELEKALEFYKLVDVAIVAGQKMSDTSVQLQWEISVVWPTFWEPRVLLTGTSKLTMSGNTIVQQADEMSDSSKRDVLSAVAPQVSPRFWDIYYIGMTPSAEVMPRLSPKRPLFSKYSVYEIPGRLVASPTQFDIGDRDDRTAQTIPNHAFSCVIKTMGPTRQRYVPTSPVQVQIIPKGAGENLLLKWSIPLSVGFQSNPQLPLPGSDSEALPEGMPECTYEFQPRRKVATVNYGGNPQDVEIAAIRKNLYEAVVKDGLKPKMDKNGRPEFFFLQNDVKACYTEEGLGMCVYEWRPKFVEHNEVGIELELS